MRTFEAAAHYPSHPELLVSNPYRLWSDIDPELPSDPIRVLGPPQSSQPGGALLEPGCRQVLPQATPEAQMPGRAQR